MIRKRKDGTRVRYVRRSDVLRWCREQSRPLPAPIVAALQLLDEAHGRVCTGCNGRGEIGGPTREGWETVPCPWCRQTAIDNPVNSGHAAVIARLTE